MPSNEPVKESEDNLHKSNRIPPRERFAQSALQFNFQEEALNLVKEQRPSSLGHRQVALYKLDHVTVALFCFEKGGSLPQHKAKGVVTIQVSEGRIVVSTNDDQHSLGAGDLLVLAPLVQHDVISEEPSTMILTVCQEH
ncbi:hypothetical protein BH11ARM1_BH11ARM1_08070 [soil metagenome]